MELTTRQKQLLVACVEAELDNNDQGDTPLSLDETEGSADPEVARVALRRELRKLVTVLKR